ncbi:MAG: pyridoxamine 5'-phosphate oxidase family protein [Deltaproteobacteria bacterium]|nr:pyridoxamine 5'-phosphate oxidase family protein [Deltaproteobacteria bacterium]
MTASAALGEDAVRAFENDAKIALLATLDADGKPHLSLITSLQARTPGELMFGQFSEGLSKQHLRADPRAGFLVMSKDRRIWRGSARWTHAAKHGDEYELYNQKPMFRYNAYFGIHTVHYLDLVALGGEEKFDAGSFVRGLLTTSLVRRLVGGSAGERILTPWAERHIGRARTLKFLAYVGGDGYPAIIPLVPCLPADSARLVVAGSVHPGEFDALGRGTTCALYALNLEMESVLVRGRWSGVGRYAGLRAATLDIDWVYNSMPPSHGVIYPPTVLSPVTESDYTAADPQSSGI